MFSIKQPAPINYYIYIIKNNKTPVYIGSTSQEISKRFTQHKTSRNSVIYQNFNPDYTNLNISIINVLNNNDGLYSNYINNNKRTLELEKILTYIYGYKYHLLNINAGSDKYINNDSLIYESVNALLMDLLDMNIILPLNVNYEIISIICDICNYPINNKELYNIISNVNDSDYVNLIKQLHQICLDLMFN